MADDKHAKAANAFKVTDEFVAGSDIYKAAVEYLKSYFAAPDVVELTQAEPLRLETAKERAIHDARMELEAGKIPVEEFTRRCFEARSLPEPPPPVKTVRACGKDYVYTLEKLEYSIRYGSPDRPPSLMIGRVIDCGAYKGTRIAWSENIRPYFDVMDTWHPSREAAFAAAYASLATQSKEREAELRKAAGLDGEGDE